MKSTVLKSNLMLLAAASVWGASFVAQRLGMDHMGPLGYSGVRFALASLFLFPLAWARRGRRPADFLRAGKYQWLWGGLVAGLAMFVGINLQQVGLVSTTAGNAGFITGLYVVIVPLAGLAWRSFPPVGVWIGAVLGAAGLYFLSVTESFTLRPGDGWVLACAFAWAGHVWILGWLSPRIETATLACGQATVCCVLSLMAAWVVGEPLTFEAMKAARGAILWGGLVSVGLGFTLQVAGQKGSPPAHAAIILSMESVVAAIAGAVVLDEQMTSRGLLGAGLMLAGMLIAQLWVEAARRG